jgi:ubiquinone/menaquinone biosynthesis C-methylase UbiE
MSKATSAKEETIKLQNCLDYATMADLKQSLLGHLQGRVLEIGPGAGLNLSYYPKDIDWIGVDLNPFVETYCQEEAERLGLTSIDFHIASAERLEVEDGSVDAVVSTYVLCSIEHLEKTLQEILRVLKPGGRFVFIEHVAAPAGTCHRHLQDWINPLWQIIADGCHPNRETGVALDQAGFRQVEYQSFKLAIPVVSPHIAGVAIK